MNKQNSPLDECVQSIRKNTEQREKTITYHAPKHRLQNINKSFSNAISARGARDAHPYPPRSKQVHPKEVNFQPNITS